MGQKSKTIFIVSFIVLFGASVLFFLYKFKNKKSNVEKCDDFVYLDKRLDCSINEVISLSKTKKFILIYDKIIKDNNNFFLITRGKDSDGEWISKKFLLGKKNFYIKISKQKEPYLRSSQISSFDTLKSKISEVPITKYNLKLKGEEIILLVSTQDGINNNLTRAFEIRYKDK